MEIINLIKSKQDNKLIDLVYNNPNTLIKFYNQNKELNTLNMVNDFLLNLFRKLKKEKI